MSAELHARAAELDRQAQHTARVAGLRGHGAVGALSAAARACRSAARTLGMVNQSSRQFIAHAGGGGATRPAGGSGAQPAAGQCTAANRAESAAGYETITNNHGEVFHMVPLGDVDFSDNPVIDSGKGGAKPNDYDWMVQAWKDTIEPGVARGMTGDDFYAIDAANQSDDFRRLGPVYDQFYGGDAIHLSGTGAGFWDVDGGRHRIDAARRLGIDRLPCRIN